MIEKRFPTKIYMRQGSENIIELWYHGIIKSRINAERKVALYADEDGNIVMRLRDTHIGSDPFFRRRTDVKFSL
jgi:hypothetical protein